MLILENLDFRAKSINVNRIIFHSNERVNSNNCNSFKCIHKKSIVSKILEVKTEGCNRIISIESWTFLYSLLVLIEKVEKH